MDERLGRPGEALQRRRAQRGDALGRGVRQRASARAPGPGGTSASMVRTQSRSARSPCSRPTWRPWALPFSRPAPEPASIRRTRASRAAYQRDERLGAVGRAAVDHQDLRRPRRPGRSGRPGRAEPGDLVQDRHDDGRLVSPWSERRVGRRPRGDRRPVRTSRANTAPQAIAWTMARSAREPPHRRVAPDDGTAPVAPRYNRRPCRCRVLARSHSGRARKGGYVGRTHRRHRERVRRPGGGGPAGRARARGHAGREARPAGRPRLRLPAGRVHLRRRPDRDHRALADHRAVRAGRPRGRGLRHAGAGRSLLPHLLPGRRATSTTPAMPSGWPRRSAPSAPYPGDAEGYREFVAKTERIFAKGFTELATKPFLSPLRHGQDRAGPGPAARATARSTASSRASCRTSGCARSSRSTRCWSAATRSRRPASTR